MKCCIFLAGSCLLFLAGPVQVTYAQPSKPKADPPADKGWLYKDVKLLCGFLIDSQCFVAKNLHEGNRGEIRFVHAGLKEGKQRLSMAIPGEVQERNKHRIAFGQLFSDVSIWHRKLFNNFNFDDFKVGKLTKGPDHDAAVYSHMIPDGSTHTHIYRWLGGERYYYDWLPLSETSFRLFLVCQCDYHALPSKNPGVYNLGRTNWQFTTAKYQGVWGADPKATDKKAPNAWQKGAWSDDESLEVAFLEPFNVYALQNNYYFVTDSGRVYYSPPLKPGEEGLRKVKLMWNDPKQPVTHLVTDVDGETPNLTYVFGDSSRPDAAKKGEKFYFKLQGTEAKASYVRQEQLQAAPNVDEPLKTLLEYSRLIRFGVAPEAKAAELPAPPPEETSHFWAISGALAAGCVVLSGGAYAIHKRR